jgi:hypothetical protein
MLSFKAYADLPPRSEGVHVRRLFEIVATQPDTTTKHVRRLFETVATQRDTTESSSTWLFLPVGSSTSNGSFEASDTATIVEIVHGMSDVASSGLNALFAAD